MLLSISEIGYDHKPNDSDIRGMRFMEREVSPSSLADIIHEGKCYTHVFRHTGRYLTMKEKEKDNFIFTHAIILDLDHQDIDMHSAAETVPLRPTIAHYTPSNGPDDIRFRFIYLFKERLNIQEYNTLYRYICDFIGLDVDERVCNQYYNGCWLCDIILNEDMIYSREQFSVLEGIDDTIPEYVPMADYQERYRNATAGILHDSGDDRYWIIGDDYYTIDRHWITGNDGKRTVAKWQTNSSRKKRLYNTALILKYNDIHNGNKPDRNWLAWSLWREYTTFYEKHPDIDYRWISTLSNDVINSDNLPDKQEHSSFKVKPGVGNKRSMARKIDWEKRKGFTDKDILSVYDPSLSLRNNIKIMNELNYKISVESLRRLLKRNGLSTDTTIKPGTDTVSL